jgi:hypothetical protein
MKKLIVLLVLVAVSLAGYSQITPGSQMRINNRVTVIGTNVPAGVTIFAVADSTFWITKMAVASTYTINTAWIASKVMRLQSGSAEIASQSFELGAPDNVSKTVVLDHNPRDTTGLSLSLNGLELRRSTDYFCRVGTDSTILIKTKCYQYDKVTVIYNR